MKRVVCCAFVSLSLAGLAAQSASPPGPGGSAQIEVVGKGKAARAILEKLYPPAQTYAVVIRHDLPAVSVRSREHYYPIEVSDDDWKGPGSMFRAKTAGNLAFGEVVKVERIDYANDRVELRIVSVDAHTIVADPNRPDRNRQEQVAARLIVPHRAGIYELMARVDAYLRLFPGLDAAREYARTAGVAQPDRRFSLAVMRRDGVLVPIASYDNGHWYRRWPLPTAERDVPIAINDIPADWWGVEGAPASWTLWTPDGKPRVVQTTAALAFGAHCLMDVGLRTNYRSPLPLTPLEQHHYPKDGLATTGSIRIETPDIVTARDAAWTSFENLVAPTINDSESRDFARMPVQFWPTRRITPVKLEVMCIAGGRQPRSDTVYFEAAKRYDAIDRSVPNPCGAVTFAHGWVQRLPSGVGQLYPGFETIVTDCSMWNVEFRRPLGVVRVGANPVWILEVSRWGGERYELVEMREAEARVVLSVPGGSCSR